MAPGAKSALRPLNALGLGTVQMDLLAPGEEAIDAPCGIVRLAA